MPPVEQETISSKLKIMAAVPGSFNQETVLFAQTSIAFPVEQGKTYKVEARKDNKTPYLSSFHDGWTYWKGTKPNVGPEGDNKNYSSGALCQHAPIGMLIGGFVPSYAEPSLKLLDLVSTTTGHNNEILQTVLSNLSPIGESWQCVATMKGYLVLLMNDGIGGYADNEGAVIIKVSPIS